MARQGSYTFENLNQMCQRRGLEYRGEKRNYSKREKVKVFCECSGERELLVSGIDASQTCCVRKSKLGENNPAYKKSPWNKGKKCPGIGGRPEGVKNSKPFSPEIRENIHKQENE